MLTSNTPDIKDVLFCSQMITMHAYLLIQFYTRSMDGRICDVPWEKRLPATRYNINRRCSCFISRPVELSPCSGYIYYSLLNEFVSKFIYRVNHHYRFPIRHVVSENHVT